jgi:oxaloacetate decarboxylase (Na+ extruding) subunit alpha
MVSERGKGRPAPLARPGRDPLVRLLGELAKRESLTYVRVEKGDDLVVWRRAA